MTSLKTRYEEWQFFRKLKKELNRRRVPDYLYNLRQRGRHDERFSIVHLEDGRWEVYYEERGVKTTDMFFGTSEEAGRYLISELTDL